MKKMGLLPLSFAVLLMSLAGCEAFKATETVVEKPVPVLVHVPERLRNCPLAPPAPGVDATQADVARYITRLHEAARTCKVRLDGVDQILDEYEASAR